MFFVSLLKNNVNRNEQIDENVIKLDFKVGNSKKYKVEII